MISCFSHFTLCVLGFISEPKVDQINQRLGPLAQEFIELVYPANYNPESKPAAKRKSGQGCNVCLARVLGNLHQVTPEIVLSLKAFSIIVQLITTEEARRSPKQRCQKKR